jgi:hypothetical protein
MPLLSFTLFYFLIDDMAMKQIAVRGHYHGGTYPLVPISTESHKHAFITIMPSFIVQQEE